MQATHYKLSFDAFKKEADMLLPEMKKQFIIDPRSGVAAEVSLCGGPFLCPFSQKSLTDGGKRYNISFVI